MIKNKNLNKGFTLIELLVVVSIISFLSSVVLASLNTARTRAMNSKIAQDLRQFEIAQQMKIDADGAFASEDLSRGSLALNQDSSGFSAKDLNIFSTKIAQAAFGATCTNFNSIAGILVARGFLSSVPKHPKDNGTSVCYKAVTINNGTLSVAYTELINSTKRVGVIVGEINNTNLLGAYNATGYEYPRNAGLNSYATLTSFGDGIVGTTKGINSSNDY